MSELISGEDVFSALSSGNEVQYNWLKNRSAKWFDLSNELKEFTLQDILSGSTGNGDVIFRLKPSTITLNGIEVPKPNKPESCYSSNGSVIIVMDDNEKAVELCLALREVFK